MTLIQPLESLQEVLRPLGSLQAENEEMAAWIHDSFSALEKLHEELTQWQSELARKETELDLRDDANEKLPPTDKGLRERVLQLDGELTAIREEMRLLEEENCEQLQEFEIMESRCAELERALAAARREVSELEKELAAERLNSSEASEKEETADKLSSVLEDQIKQLTSQLQKLQGEQTLAHATQNPTLPNGVSSKSAELRRRAESRRAGKQ
jgi:chromosome segregation ATPase